MQEVNGEFTGELEEALEEFREEWEAKLFGGFEIFLEMYEFIEFLRVLVEFFLFFEVKFLGAEFFGDSELFCVEIVLGES
jgi:hypothetical protein